MKKIVYLLLLLVSLIPFSGAQADDTELYVLTQVMQEVPPDALIVLDLSGSMNWTPAGGTLYIDAAESNHCDNNSYEGNYDGPYYSQSGGSHTWKCNNVPYTSDRPRYGDATCSETTGFYKTSVSDHTTDCSRLAIAKRALFKFLDTDDDGVDPAVPNNIINNLDQDYLKIRMGYMRFYNCSGAETVTSTSYSGPPNPSNRNCNTLIQGVNTDYSMIYCKDGTSCTPSSSGSSVSIASESATNGTPVAAALNEAKYYLDYTKTGDTYAACRQKFVILLTDGADTFACPGTWGKTYQNGSESNQYQYMGRRETVARARELANAGYYVFVIGFGSNMPYYLQNTLNWAGYYGMTKNTAQTQSISDWYTIPYGEIYPSGVSQCSTTNTTKHADGHYYANSNDPGEKGISGYAFIAQNSDELDAAITAIRNFIIQLNAESTSYVAPVVPISQYQSTSSEDLMYLGMFKPTAMTMWKGNIKKFGIATTDSATIKVGDVLDANGALAMDAADNTIKETARSYWSTSADGAEVEAGGVGGLLQARDPNSRNLYTYFRDATNPNSTNLTDASNAFSLSNRDPEDSGGKISAATLGVTTTAERDNVINFVHGWDAWDWDKDGNTTEKRDWILGAIIHSRPVVIHYTDYDVIYVGGNDGMLHAFKDSKGTTGDDGTELWGFIPPDLLGNLKNFNSVLASLQIFVDGSPKYYRMEDGTTILIFGERRGGNHYYALDVTDPIVPKFLWSINPSEIITGTTLTPSTDYQQLGQTWSTPKFGKIKNGTGTKVVAFIGGGYDANQDTDTPSSDTHGKAVYVVDITNGNRIWGYSSMTYCVPSDITPIDSLLPTGTNGDGLIDRLYVGNMGGQIWRFDLCSSTTGPCVPDMSSTGNWTGVNIFNGSGKMFYPPDVSFENSRDASCSATFSGTYNMLYFGTGDREKPNNTTSNNRLYAVKDYDILPVPFTTITESCLTDVTSYGTPVPTSSMGWYIRLNQSEGTNPNPGEKCSGQAVVLGGAIYYTTFTPTPDSSACEIGTGSGNIYIVQYLTANCFFDLDGDGVSEAGDRSVDVVAGIPSGVIIAIINGSTVKTYGGVPAGVISPRSSISNAIIPIDWRILF